MIRTTKIENTDFVWFYSNLNRFTLQVVTVIETINYCLLQSLIRIIVYDNRTFCILWLVYYLLYDVRLEIVQCVPNHLRHTTSDWCNLYHVIRVLQSAFGKYYNLHLCHLEKPLRMVAKHHGSHILHLEALRCHLQQIHLVENIF